MAITMSARDATYVTPQRFRTETCQCLGCDLSVYARTAQSRFCGLHWRRAVIACYAEECFPTHLWTPSRTVVLTALRQWQRFVRRASDEEIYQAYDALELDEGVL